MKVWTMGHFENIEIGQKVFVGRCSSGRTVFGEYATLTKVMAQHLIFTTDSGSIVKTQIETLNTVGKAAKNHYWISLKTEGRDFIKERVSYWNNKKMCSEYK